MTYEVFNLSHTRSFLSELAVKDYSYGSQEEFEKECPSAEMQHELTQVIRNLISEKMSINLLDKKYTDKIEELCEMVDENRENMRK